MWYKILGVVLILGGCGAGPQYDFSGQTAAGVAAQSERAAVIMEAIQVPLQQLQGQQYYVRVR